MAFLTPVQAEGVHSTVNVEKTAEEPILTASDPSQEDIRHLIEQEFGENHIMLKVAMCESGVNQYNEDGSLLYNAQGSSAVGVFQIMESYHYENALALGYDVRTTEGNIAFAKHLYDLNGLRDWKASEHCWL